jgi:hypothetical protein
MSNLVLCGWEWGTIREASAWRYSVGEGSIKTNKKRSGDYSCFVNIYDHVYFSIPCIGYLGLEEIYVQFAMLFDSILGMSGSFFCWKGEQGGLTLGTMTVGVNGQVLLYTGCSGDILAVEHPTTAPNTLRIASHTRLLSDVWYVVELYIKTHTTAGTITLKIDGNIEGTFSGNTANGNASEWGHTNYKTDTLDFYNFNGMYFDDVVVDDAIWPGCQKIVLLRPEAEGDIIEWSRTNDYDNYEHVNEVPPNTEDYVYTTQLNRTDLYQVEQLPDDAYEIANVRGDAWAVKNSASNAQNASIAFALKNGVTTASSVFVSDTQNLYLSWKLVSYSWDIVNPDTGYTWTVDDINIIQSGVVSE